MDFTKATKAQLHHILLHEKVSQEDQYEICRELQSRQFRGDMMIDLVRMYPFHSITEIAEWLGVPYYHVRDEAKRLGLRKGKSA